MPIEDQLSVEPYLNKINRATVELHSERLNLLSFVIENHSYLSDAEIRKALHYVKGITL